jgi:Rrf2 family protein
MRVSAKAEYACVAMLELAASYAARQPVPIKAIAEATGIPLVFLGQILLQLKTAGLATSVRGAAGGYQLARSPEAISLVAIIHAIDGRDPAVSSALNKVTPAPVVTTLLGVWKDVQAEEQRLRDQMLEQLSLAELLRRTQAEKDALMYQI